VLFAIAVGWVCGPPQEPEVLKLESLQAARDGFAATHFKTFPPELQRMLGKWVVVEGFLAPVFFEDEVDGLVLSQDMRDPSIGLNNRPDPFTSVRVDLRNPPEDVNTRYAKLSGRFSVKVVLRGDQVETLFLLSDAVDGAAPPPPEREEPAEEGRLKFSTLLRARRYMVGREEEVKDIERLPEEVEGLGGRWVTIVGYLLVPGAVAEAREFTVGRDPWDGCCLGKPPTIFDSLWVKLREGERVRSPFPPLITVSGRLRIEPQKIDGLLVGLFHLDDARVGAHEDPGKAGAKAKESYLFRILLIPAFLAFLGACALFLRRRMGSGSYDSR
jgi:hypothetical protein